MTAPKTPAKLVILRHGETPYNVGKLMTGQRDVPLTERGKEQAREAGQLLKSMTFGKVYSSSLSRAFNTAAMALDSAGINLPIEKRDEIIELDAGDFTGRCHKADPEIIAYKRYYDRKLPGGESGKDVVARVQAFFDAEVMPRLIRGENVLIFAHAGVLRAFDIVLGVERVPDDGEIQHSARRIPNAAPAVYEYEDGALKNFYYIENAKSDPHLRAPANQNDTQDPPQKRKGGQGPSFG